MNKNRFLDLIKDPSKLESSDLKKLQEVVEMFPYFQAAHVLVAKLLRDESSMYAGEKLSLASAYTLDRKNLKKIMKTKSHSLTVYVNPAITKEAVLPVEENTPAPTISLLVPQEEIVQTPPIQDVVEEEKADLNIPAIIDETPSPVEVEETKVVQLEAVFPVAETPIEEQIETIEAPIAIQETPEVKPKETTTAPDDFYSDLQKNLEELRKAKVSFVQQHTVEEDKNKEVYEDLFADVQPVEAPVIALKPVLDEPEGQVQEIRIAPQSEEITQQDTIETSRLDSVILGTLTAEDTSEERDLLIEYFDFLEQRRRARVVDKKVVESLIDKFIAEEPTIPKLDIKRINEPLVDLSEKSTVPKVKIISENFAKILVIQGNYAKAVEMYQELALKYPEKKAYFAERIQEIKNKQ